MPEPKTEVKTIFFKGFENKQCEFFPCHQLPKRADGTTRTFNCLNCWCGLYFLECPGPYKVFEDANGLKRKDCTDCYLNHNGIEQSWNFIQTWMTYPLPWSGEEQTYKFTKPEHCKQELIRLGQLKE